MRPRILLLAGSIALISAGALVSAGALAATGEKLARLNAEETQLSAVQARNVNQLARLLSVLQQFERDPPPALLVSPADARDAVRAAILVKAMTPALQGRARGYAVEAGEMARQRRLAAVQSEALFEVESARADRAPEPRSGGDMLLRRNDAERALTAPDKLLVPAAGRWTRSFGAELPGGGTSNGITIAAPKSGRVISPGPGTVQYVGPVKGWGVIVILKLAGGYHLVLAGLERASVPVGQSVAAGEPIGIMPEGRQSTSELYLEVREQGSPLDPAQWLRARG